MSRVCACGHQVTVISLHIQAKGFQEPHVKISQIKSNSGPNLTPFGPVVKY